MISLRFKFIPLLLCLYASVPSVVGRVASAEVETDFILPTSGIATFGLLRKPDVSVGKTRAISVSSRELYGSQWSWSNLFFHLGICKPERCHKGIGPCACPDCSKPYPAIFNGYCTVGDSSYTADSSSSGGGEESRAFYDNGSSGSTGNGPNATRRSFLWWVVGGAGVAATAVGAAFAMRKRTATMVAANKGVVSATSASSNYKLMGAAGVGAVIAGAMTKLGLKSTDDLSSTSGSSNGVVSKRIGLMKHAEELPRVDDASVTPSFVEVRSSTRGFGSETFIEDLDGMEVQGPYRPSSNYAV